MTDPRYDALLKAARKITFHGIDCGRDCDEFTPALKELQDAVNAFDPPYKEWSREICGRFPGGYQFCTIIGQDKPENPEWLKFRTDNGRIAWAKFRLGHCVETDPTQFDHPEGWPNV